MNKKDLLSFLKQQDSIADYAQTAAYWMTLRSCKDIPEEIKKGFLELMAASLKTARLYDELAGALYKLLATSFSKEEIKETMTIIPEVERLEHEFNPGKPEELALPLLYLFDFHPYPQPHTSIYLERYGLQLLEFAAG